MTYCSVCILFPQITTISSGKILSKLSLTWISINLHSKSLALHPSTTVVSDWKFDMNINEISLGVSEKEEAMAWLIGFIGKTRSEKKSDKAVHERITHNGDMTTADPENTAVQDYCRPRENVLVAEGAKFLSTVQNQRQSDGDFWEKICEYARCFKFSEPENTADREKEMIQMKLISRLRSADSKLKLLRACRVISNINVTVLKTVLQGSNHAQHFADTSKGNIEEETAYNSFSFFRKPGNVEIACNGTQFECPNCGGKPHRDKFSPLTSKKCNSCGKIERFAIKCRRKLSNNKTGNSIFNRKGSHHADRGQF